LARGVFSRRGRQHGQEALRDALAAALRFAAPARVEIVVA